MKKEPKQIQRFGEMKEVNLGKTNEEINWKRDDEIGKDP